MLGSHRSDPRPTSHAQGQRTEAHQPSQSEQIIGKLQVQIANLQYDNEILRGQLVELTRQNEQLMEGLREAREDHAAIRSQIQPVNNRESRDVVEQFVALKEKIRTLCYTLGRSIVEELGLPDSMPACNSTELRQELGSSVVLMPSVAQPAPLFDAFFEFAFRYRFNYYLCRDLFGRFHENNDFNKLIKKAYGAVGAHGMWCLQFSSSKRLPL
jgi:hypothetical protein